MKELVPALLLVGAFAMCGCRSLGSYTWYTEVPRSEAVPPPGQFVIAAGDTISIRVYDQEALSTHGKIRSDGRLAMPFIGEVIAAGRTPEVLAQEIADRLKVFIVSPRVTVNVEDTPPILVSVLGEVGGRGNLSLQPPATVLQALAQAGGPSEFADKDAIFLVRQKPTFRRIRFTYDALITNAGGAATFPVRTGDIIVVQ